MARGFSSAGAWVQACGRVVRPFPGKTKAIIIDLRGSVYLWGLPDEDRSYSLEGKAMRIGADDDGASIRQCRVCQRVFRASEFKDAACPACGAMTKGKPDPAVRRETMARVLATHTVEDKRRKFAELRAVAAAKGYSHKWSVIQFKLRYGHWPGKDMR
jgi:superfamily II DNA or RNA helicase